MAVTVKKKKSKPQTEGHLKEREKGVVFIFDLLDTSSPIVILSLASAAATLVLLLSGVVWGATSAFSALSEESHVFLEAPEKHLAFSKGNI